MKSVFRLKIGKADSVSGGVSCLTIAPHKTLTVPCSSGRPKAE